MSSAYLAGLVLYQLKIGLDALLLCLVWKYRRQWPGFTAWIGFGLARSLVLFPLFHLAGHAAYTAVYWPTRIFDGLCLAWATGEAAGSGPWGLLAGVIYASAQTAHLSVSVDRGLALAVSIVAGVTVLRRGHVLAAGILLATLPEALLMTYPVLQEAYLGRFLPTVGYVAAQLIWIGWLWRRNKLLYFTP